MLNNLHILWTSVTPSLETGYGRITYNVVSRLLEAGFDIICYGLQTYGIRQLLTTKGKTFPIVGTENAEFDMLLIDKMKKHMKENNRNCLLSLWDVWNLPKTFANEFPTWIPYIPLDAEITDENYFISRNAFKRIAMSKFGQREFKKVLLDSTYIPHGVDTTLYKPYTREEKLILKQQFGFPKDAFIIGTVGKNYFDRKRFDRMLQIFSLFVKRNNLKDAYLLMHTEGLPREISTGYDIIRLANLCDVADYVSLPTRTNIPDGDMVASYNCMNVYLSTSAAEGFGLPIAEAQSCGTPAIVPDNSAQPEHVEGHGWIIPCSEWDCRLTTPLHNKWWMIDIEPAVKALEDAYENRDKIETYGQEARQFVVNNYDWKNVIENYWIPFLDQSEKDMLNHPIYRNWINSMKYWKTN